MTITRIAFLLSVLMAVLGSAEARSKLQGYAFKAGNNLASAGLATNVKPLEVYPRCTVSIFEAGTKSLATIYSDDHATKPNPFTADEKGYWWFYADAGRYDVEFSGAGIATPFRLNETVFATASVTAPPTCGVTVLNACGTNANEPAWAGYGATATIIQGADSTSASPSNSALPAFSFQTWRNGSGTIIGYPFALYRTAGEGDDYGVFSFLTYTANMSGFSGGVNQHAMRSYLILGPSNVGSNAAYGYSLWVQGERQTAGNVRVVGAQIDANNNTSTDADPDDMNQVNTTFAIATNAGAGKHNTAIIFSQAENSTAYSIGWRFSYNSIYRYGLDFKDSHFQMQGTVAATNGSTTVTGTSTFFLTEILPGDQVIFQGVYPYTVASITNNTSLTLTSTYAQTTGSGLTITKFPHPIRMAPQSYITSHNLSDNADYRFAGLQYISSYGDQWSIDPDARGVAFGGSLILRSVTQANLGTPPDGTLVYCTNCTQVNPCASAGSGALAKRIAGAWQCK